MAAPDPHAVLGVHETAGRAEIRAAFRQHVKRLHPDRNPRDPSAAARYREVVDAYDSLRGAVPPSPSDTAGERRGPESPAALDDAMERARQAVADWAPGSPALRSEDLIGWGVQQRVADVRADLMLVLTTDAPIPTFVVVLLGLTIGGVAVTPSRLLPGSVLPLSADGRSSDPHLLLQRSHTWIAASAWRARQIRPNEPFLTDTPARWARRQIDALLAPAERHGRPIEAAVEREIADLESLAAGWMDHSAESLSSYVTAMVSWILDLEVSSWTEAP